MSWDNYDVEKEFVKFDFPKSYDKLLMDYEDLEILHCKVDWDSLEEITNQWNKKQKIVDVIKFAHLQDKELNEYFEPMNIEFRLAMGTRLFNAMKMFHTEFPKQKNIKILRVGKKFNIHYYIHKLSLNGKK